MKRKQSTGERGSELAGAQAEVSVVEAWARRASHANGFGDAWVEIDPGSITINPVLRPDTPIATLESQS